jgi:lysophospholipase L1-like esterase
MASWAVTRRTLAVAAVSAAVGIAAMLAAGPGGAAAAGRAAAEAAARAAGPGAGRAPGRLTGAVSRPGAVPGGGAVRCRVTGDSARPAPARHRLVVLGASFTAGVGAAAASDSWAVRLAELIEWPAVTVGVPGAGYTRPGLDHLGPMSRELSRVDLAAIHPSVVVIQAGHDDGRVPEPVEADRVAALVRRLRAEAPAARLALLTVFSRPGASSAVVRAEFRTDFAIVSAARAADPRVIVIDPLRGHWRFPRARDGLHPTTLGHLLIARRVARTLVRAGAVAAAAARPARAEVICEPLALAGTARLALVGTGRPVPAATAVSAGQARPAGPVTSR